MGSCTQKSKPPLNLKSNQMAQLNNKNLSRVMRGAHGASQSECLDKQSSLDKEGKYLFHFVYIGIIMCINLIKLFQLLIGWLSKQKA